jgi:hypothetical protein
LQVVSKSSEQKWHKGRNKSSLRHNCAPATQRAELENLGSRHTSAWQLQSRQRSSCACDRDRYILSICGRSLRIMRQINKSISSPRLHSNISNAARQPCKTSLPQCTPLITIPFAILSLPPCCKYAEQRFVCFIAVDFEYAGKTPVAG